MVKRKFVESLNSAVEGFIYVLKTQRNMRLHFLVAILVLVGGIRLNLTKEEMLALLGTITLVLVTEMINTAVEYTIDLIRNAFHPLARIIKDVTAGAVFLTALNAVVCGYIIFSKHFEFHIEEGVYKIGRSPWHLTFIAFLLVLFAVVVWKVAFHRGTPFRGGMPSGHAAFAFSIWTVIAFSAKNSLIIILSFVMAFMIARHRLKDNIHNLWEVAAGSVLGILLTASVFQFLRW